MTFPRFAHVVNPYATEPGSAAALAQEVSLRALRIARDCAPPGLSITLCAAVFEDDLPLVPGFFSQRTLLSRSILDLTAEHDGRRLPLLADILAGLSACAGAEYFIYSNIDIAPMPYFYPSLAQIAARGYDAFIVTRRTITTPFRSGADLPLMYAEIGIEHPGCDCFIFRSEWLEKFQLGRVVVGGEFVALALRANLEAQAQRMEIFRNLHLTFHLGDERAWLQHTADARFNEREVDGLFPRLLAGPDPSRKQALLELHADYLKRKRRLRERSGQGER